ncbi:MAG: 50S ribosomal protein L4 [Deltaproteobacteria bacterium]|nr:50S ribosomal protein L4 [Deltaproteobacteria bacterium]
MKFDVVDTQNTKVGEIDLDDSVFAAEVRHHLFWEVVKMQLANRRRGTHSTKTVREVAGTGKKPYKQKGTGRARHGASRAMNMRGGGVVHGPRPRDYSYKMPKKALKAALRSALSLRVQQSALHVVRGWAPAKPKTKDALAILGRFDAAKALVVDKGVNEALALSVRNLAKAKYLPAEALNVYDILKYDHLLISEEAVQQLVDRLQTEPSRKELELKEAASNA